jgi:hypothetical protein
MKLKLAVLVLVAASQIAYADSYDPATNQLTIPTITLPNGATYKNVVVTVGSVLGYNTGVPGAADSYDPATNALTIPGITVLGTTLTNVKITIGAVLAATAVGPAAPTTYPPFANLAVRNALPIPAGKTLTYDNHGVINGIYNCSLSNTGLNRLSPSSTPSNIMSTGVEYVPQFTLSVAGKSNGKAHVTIAQASAPAVTGDMYGSVEMMISGNSVSGYTMDGGAITVNFAYTPNPATGIDDITGTGTVVLNGQDSSGQPYSKTANLSCNSVKSL